MDRAHRPPGQGTLSISCPQVATYGKTRSTVSSLRRSIRLVKVTPPIRRCRRTCPSTEGFGERASASGPRRARSIKDMTVAGVFRVGRQWTCASSAEVSRPVAICVRLPWWLLCLPVSSGALRISRSIPGHAGVGMGNFVQG